jgi:hypothetical protein
MGLSDKVSDAKTMLYSIPFHQVMRLQLSDNPLKPSYASMNSMNNRLVGAAIVYQIDSLLLLGITLEAATSAKALVNSEDFPAKFSINYQFRPKSGV